MGQLLLANVHSPTFHPVVVLTDLQEYWQLLWMDGNMIYTGACKSAAAGVACVNSLIEQVCTCKTIVAAVI